MKKIYAVLISIGLAAMFIAAAVPLGNGSYDDSGPLTQIVGEKHFSDRDVIVFGGEDGGFAAKVADSLSELTSKVALKSDADFSELTRYDIAVIDETWIYNGNEALVDAGIERMLDREVPIIFVGGAQYLYKDSAVSLDYAVYGDNPNAYAIYRGSIDYQMQTSSPDVNDDIAFAYEWAVGLSSDLELFGGAIVSWDGVPKLPQTLAAYGESHISDGRGHDFLRTKFIFKIDPNDDGFDRYSVSESVYVRAGSDLGYRVADVFLTGDFTNGEAGAYLTSTSPRTGEYEGRYSESGPSQYIPLINSSYSGPNGNLNYWYNVDERGSVGLKSAVHSSYDIRSPSGSGFTYSDEYEVNIYHYNASVIFGFIIWSSYEPDHTLNDVEHVIVKGSN